MAKTPPFFRHTQHPTGLRAAAPVAERYPYHDNDQCPIGLAIKQDGNWQYYDPTTVDETRARCPTCVGLDVKDTVTSHF